MTATVGIIANPLAGRDIRRLVSEASPTSDIAKVGIVRRAVIGAVEGGAQRVLLADDRRQLGLRAVEGLERADGALANSGAKIVMMAEPVIDSGRNSERAAHRCREEGAGAVIVLGGDGTQRDVTKGWRQAPLVPLSTGTNNVFPRQVEATVAGHAAGLVASGRIGLAEASFRAKCIDVQVEGGDTNDLALVDVALVNSTFTASRAVWDPTTLRELLACIAEPATVGLSAIGAALAPTDRREAGGVHVQFAPSTRNDTGLVRAPIAPGLYAEVAIAAHRRVPAGETVVMEGPGSLSFDGERDVVLRSGQQASLTIAADGPHVIDVEQAMHAAVRTQQDMTRQRSTATVENG